MKISIATSGEKMKSLSMTVKSALGALAVAGAIMASGNGLAADWSDTSLSYRTGSKFAEPFGRTDISKNIVALTHASGYKYGTNFFNADLLMSDNKDPSTVGGPTGAQEAYIVYRNTVDLSKVTGSEYKFGIVRGVGGTFGFDWNTKNDFGYASKKRMLVVGPTLMIDVPGFLNLSLLALGESNAPLGISRYTYKTHPMLSAAWGIPIGSLPFSFEGFMLVIAPKGNNEFGGPTKAETNFDGQIMLDVSSVMGGPKGTFKVGFEYQWWKNKFGNDASGPAGPGAFAKTPMIRAEYHF
jgi:hypothetical protein